MALSVVSRSQKQAVHSLQPYLLLQAICTARSFSVVSILYGWSPYD